MKEFPKNAQKVISYILIGVLIICVVIFVKKTIASGYLLEQRMKNVIAKNNQKTLVPVDCPKHGDSLFAELEIQTQAGEQIELKRDLFSEFKDKVAVDEVDVLVRKPIIEVLEIEYKPLSIRYLGRIVFENGKIVAQVNIYNKSYLVYEGSKIAEMVVETINKDLISLKDKRGNFTKIKFRQLAYSNKLIAKIKEHNSQQTLEISKDSDFFGYKVLDINEDYVLVSNQGQHLRLEKGRVYK